MLRREFLAASFAALAGTAGLAVAEEAYPARPVRLVVPSQAGGVYDLMGRMWADRIAPRSAPSWSKTAPAESATVGVAAAAKAAPDGYTLLLASNATHVLTARHDDDAAVRCGQRFRRRVRAGRAWTAIVVHRILAGAFTAQS